MCVSVSTCACVSDSVCGWVWVCWCGVSVLLLQNFMSSLSRLRVCTHTHTHTHTYTHICMYVCMYINTHTHTHTQIRRCICQHRPRPISPGSRAESAEEATGGLKTTLTSKAWLNLGTSCSVSAGWLHQSGSRGGEGNSGGRIGVTLSGLLRNKG